MTEVLDKSWLDRSWLLTARPRDASTGFFGVVEFDATGEVNFGNVLDQTSDSFSIQIRVKSMGTGADESILGRRQTTAVGDAGFSAIVDDSTGGGFTFEISDGATEVGVASLGAISDAIYETYTMVVDRVADLALLYAGSVLQDSQSIAAVGSVTNGQNLYLARLGDGVLAEVSLGEFRFWSVALTATEAADNFAGELDINNLPVGLELYWRSREGVGTVATDETTNGFDGTLLNPIWGIPGDPAVLLDVRLSSDGHRELPTDPEEIQYRAGLKGPFSYGSNLNGLWGFADSRVGEITLGDGDGKFRSLAREDWISREMEVAVGRRDAAAADFDTVAFLLSRQVRYGRDSLAIGADDHGYGFRLPIQTVLYAGTGDLEGTTSMANFPKPLAFGKSHRVQPVLVKPSQFIYQFHDGSMESIEDVLSGWLEEFTFDSDVADIEAGNVPASRYTTSLANGFIRFGSLPSGIVTAVIEGFNTGGYVDALGDLLTLMATTFGGLDPGDVDVSGVAGFTAPMGVYITEAQRKQGNVISTIWGETAPGFPGSGPPPQPPDVLKRATTLDVIRSLCSSGLAWARVTPARKFIAGRITDPNASTPDYTVVTDIRNTPWDSVPWEVPVGRVFVGYQKYYETTGVGSTEVISPVAGDGPDFAQEHRFVKAENMGLFDLVPDARELVILTELDLETDAQAVADEQLALREVLREKLTLGVRTGLTDRGVGDVVRVEDSRLPGGPRNFVVTGADSRAGDGQKPDSVVLKCFG